MGLDVNARFESVLIAAEQMAPDAYFFTGDFCAYEPVAEIYECLRPRLEGLEKPYFMVAGNHDDRSMMRAAMPRLSGTGNEPIYLTTTVGGHDFIILDTSEGRLDDGQLDSLRSDLADHPRAMLVMHHPPLPMGAVFMDANYPLADTDRLIDLLTADGQRRRVICGHYHTGRSVSHRNLDVYLCPATSFHINPRALTFEMDDLPPHFQLFEWTDEGDFRQSLHATWGEEV